MTVTASASALGEITLAEIRRRASEIVVGEYLERPTRCSGEVPTVFNTDMISVVVRGDASVSLRLDGGPFAPGATPEAEGAPEIEIEFSGGLIVGGAVVGTRGADEFHWGPGGVHAGLNLNPRSDGDQDVDVTARGAILMAEGRAGNDTIIPGPGPVVADGVFSVGGQGADRLIAPRHTDGILYGGRGKDVIGGGDAFDSLKGGAGNDMISGGGAFDSLKGGAGNDRVEGGDGSDEINGGRGDDLLSGGRGRDSIRSRDGMRDQVSCGAGRDRATADRRDRLRGCELTRRP